MKYFLLHFKIFKFWNKPTYKRNCMPWKIVVSGAALLLKKCFLYYYFLPPNPVSLVNDPSTFLHFACQCPRLHHFTHSWSCSHVLHFPNPPKRSGLLLQSVFFQRLLIWQISVQEKFAPTSGSFWRRKRIVWAGGILKMKWKSWIFISNN